jgi:hypothetical protein
VRIAALTSACLEIVDKRVYTSTGHVRVVIEIEARVEERMGITPLPPAD